MAGSDTLLEAANISIRPRQRVSDRWLVDSVGFELNRGEVLGLVGESGSGKTLSTLALLGLAGARLDVTGALRFDGECFDLSAPDRLRPLRGARIGMIFQDPRLSLNPVRTIAGHFRELWPGRHGSGPSVRQRSADLLHSVGISDPDRRLRQYPHELSGGMCQRVMIALALATEPTLLIADEPTTALDTTVQAQILDLIDTLRRERGLSVIMISHDLAVISEIADRVAVMRHGRMVETGSQTAIFNNAQSAYTRSLVGFASKSSLGLEGAL